MLSKKHPRCALLVLVVGLLYLPRNLPDGDVRPRLLCYDLRPARNEKWQRAG